MASTIKIKRSNTSKNVPDAASDQIIEGELALNTRDGILYSRGGNDNDAVFEIGANNTSLSISGAPVVTSNTMFVAHSLDQKEEQFAVQVMPSQTNYGTGDSAAPAPGKIQFGGILNTSLRISYFIGASGADVSSGLKRLQPGDVITISPDGEPENTVTIKADSVSYNDAYKWVDVVSAPGTDGVGDVYSRFTDSEHAALQTVLYDKNVKLSIKKKATLLPAGFASSDGKVLFSANGVFTGHGAESEQDAFYTFFRDAINIDESTAANPASNESFISNRSNEGTPQISVSMSMTQYNQGAVSTDFSETIANIETGDYVSFTLKSDPSKRLAFTVESTTVDHTNSFVRLLASDVSYNNFITFDNVTEPHTSQSSNPQNDFRNDYCTVIVKKKARTVPRSHLPELIVNDLPIVSPNGDIINITGNTDKITRTIKDVGTTEGTDFGATANGEAYFQFITGDSQVSLRVDPQTSGGGNQSEFLMALSGYNSYTHTGAMILVRSVTDRSKYILFTKPASVQAFSTITYINMTFSFSNVVVDTTDNYQSGSLSWSRVQQAFVGDDVDIYIIPDEQFVKRRINFVHGLNEHDKIRLNGVYTDYSGGATIDNLYPLHIGTYQNSHSNLSSSYRHMTFTAHNYNQGFVWRDNTSGTNQAGMSLRADGKLAVAYGVRIGFGENDTANQSSTYRLQVSGQIYSSSNITAYSDKRAKENIKPISGALDKVLDMQGVYYNMKKEHAAEHEDHTRQRIGVLAQDIQNILPEVVSYCEEDDRYSVDYGNITAILIEAIKDQQNIIEDLKSRIETLENVD